MQGKDFVDIKEVKAEERFLLLQVCEMLERGKTSLEILDFAVAQGALRAGYNGLAGLVQDSMYLAADRKKELETQGDRIFQVRDKLVTGVEAEGRNLAEVIEASDAYKELDNIKKVLRSYVNKWYKH